MDEVKQATAVCPQMIRQALVQMPSSQIRQIEEIRLRTGQPPTYLKSGREKAFASFLVQTHDLAEVIDRASDNSNYAVQDMLKSGFLTIAGGHRIGVCGRVVYKENEIYSIKDISSLNIRVARQVSGVADSAISFIWTHPRSTLILGPPGRGKTTLLRDLIRQLSDRFFWRICVVDERMEIASIVKGVSQFALGSYTDVLSCVRKEEGIEFLLRSMNPQWIALDEITAQKDIEAMTKASYCGVRFIATAHAACIQELQQRPLYQNLLASRVFQNVILIDENRNLHMEVLTND
ncbi:MAG: stage III sporulation protein AB [Ruminococcaceae bacterium]|nr:stage III sporulation protein AB [Oscillospiraceae bacterium]